MKRHFNFCRAIAGLIVTVLVGPFYITAAADDWPVARGDVQGTGVARSELPDQLDVLWKYRAGKDAGFDASPVVAKGVIYLGDSAGTVHAVRLSDGGAVWTKTFDNAIFSAAAAIDGERLYLGDMNGAVRCLATSNGDERWSRELNAEIYAGPTPVGENVLVTAESGTLCCLRAADGSDAWPPFKIDAPLRCTPTIFADRVMLAGCDSLLHVIDATSGKQVETVKIDGPTGSTPAMHKGRVYFGTEGGTFFAIDVPASGDKKPSVAWTFHDPRRGQPIRSAAAVTDALVVFGSQGKAIFALNLRSGEPKWTAPTRTRVDSSPVIAGRRVIAACGSKVFLLDAAMGDVKWEYDAGGSFTASPAVVDGRIILPNTDGTLYCFGSKDKTKFATEDTENTERKKE